MYADLPLSPRKARHFPPRSGEADTEEKRIHSFYISKNKKYRIDSYQKAVPGHGEGVSGADGRGKLEQIQKMVFTVWY